LKLFSGIRPPAVASVLGTARSLAESASPAGSRLGTITLIELDEQVLEAAAQLDPVELRSADALPLATAMSLGGDLDRVCRYDARLADAADAVNPNVVRPA